MVTGDFQNTNKKTYKNENENWNEVDVGLLGTEIYYFNETRHSGPANGYILVERW